MKPVFFDLEKKTFTFAFKPNKFSQEDVRQLIEKGFRNIEVWEGHDSEKEVYVKMDI